MQLDSIILFLMRAQRPECWNTRLCERTQHVNHIFTANVVSYVFTYFQLGHCESLNIYILLKGSKMRSKLQAYSSAEHCSKMITHYTVDMNPRRFVSSSSSLTGIVWIIIHLYFLERINMNSLFICGAIIASILYIYR
jgi:hypothetical protein